jgi:hypothetical protein
VRKLKRRDPMMSGFITMTKPNLKAFCVRMGIVIENGDRRKELLRKIKGFMEELWSTRKSC